MNIKNIFWCASMSLLHIAQTQSVLTLENALQTGLQNNYDILLARQEVEISKTQDNIGNAGMSPLVSATSGNTLASANSYQEFATGTTQERRWAQSQNTNLAINVNWIVFDGFKMFAIKKRLGIATEVNQLNYQQTLQNAVFDISLAYYNLVRIQQLIKANKQNFAIYEEREKISKVKYEIGIDNKVDLALIQLDKNRTAADIKRLEQEYLTAKIDLNKILARNIEEDFAVTDSIPVQYNASYEDLKKDVIANNPTLRAYRKSELLQYQYIKEARSNLFPIIQLNSSYNILRAQNQAGLLLKNQQSGFNGGITASWLLFGGFRNSEYIQERKLRYVSQQYLTRQAQFEIDAVVYTQYKSFALQKELMLLEKQNLEFAESVVAISTERYKVGKATILETKELQRNLEDVQIRYTNALYEAKRAELELLRASNQLVR